MTTTRAVSRLGLVGALVALAVLPWVVGYDDLPAQVATHWRLDGTPDGHLSRAAAALALGGVGTALAVAVGVLLHRPRLPQASITPVVGLCSALLGALGLVTVLVHQDAATWRDADLDPLHVIASVASALVAGAAVARVAPEVVAAIPEGARVRPSMDLRAGETAVWFGRGRNGLQAVAGIGTIVVSMVVVAAAGRPWIAALLSPTLGIVVVGTTSVRVVVGERGVDVAAGLLRRLRLRFPMAEIESAAAIDLEPHRWGGWGYRGSLRYLRRAAWVVRRGPALELSLTGGRRFAVTVDDPTGAAALINALRARQT